MHAGQEFINNVSRFYNGLKDNNPCVLKNPENLNLDQLSPLDLLNCAYEKTLQIWKKEKPEEYQRIHPKTLGERIWEPTEVEI